ncbi:hypothetical protein LUZ60_011152 [Juncus effusus]|nr:hypothetical protein LUZ60_011152 [Juncus effusus]
MEVQIQSSRIIPPQHDSQSFPKKVPLTIFDRFATNIHIAVIWAFTPPTPTNETLINGLYKTLQYFPTLTAKLNQSQDAKRPCLITGGLDGGALLVETIVNSKLSDHLPLEPTPDFLKLHPSADDPDHLHQVQINRFKDDGVIISTTTHHRVADGQSMGLFYTTWARMVRGEPMDRLPVYDLSWLKPRSPPRCEFNHWGQEFVPVDQNGSTVDRVDVDPSEITNVLLRYPKEFIEKLKVKVKYEYTTFETVLGYVWRKISIARRLKDEELAQIRIAVNGRTRIKPPVPREFVGNLVVSAYSKSNIKQLIAGGVTYAAKLIHEAIIKADNNYIQSFIDFGELYGSKELVPVYDRDGNVVSPKLAVDSWLGLRFEEVDFGGGAGPNAFLPTWVPYEGVIMFVPNFDKAGGLGVFVTMLVEHAKLLKEISHSMD